MSSTEEPRVEEPSVEEPQQDVLVETAAFTATLTVPPPLKMAKPAAPKGTRKTSPARLFSVFIIKARAQEQRVSALMELLNTLPTTPEQVTNSRIEGWYKDTVDLHEAFLSESMYLEGAWPEAHLDHPYFTGDIFMREARAIRLFRQALAMLKDSMPAPLTDRSSPANELSGHFKFPDISLPRFSGDYAEWPSYRDLFKSLGLNNKRLSDVEKLHYLHGSLDSFPAQLISALPLTNNSLNVAWEKLTTRFENKRRIVFHHVERIFNVTPPTSKSPTALRDAIGTVSEALKMLRTHIPDAAILDTILIHHVLRQLDKTTRQAWETALGAQQECPTLTRLEEFLASRADAMEMAEKTAAPPQSTPAQGAPPAKKTVVYPGSSSAAASTSRRPPSAHPVSTQSRVRPEGGSGSYPCDACDGAHCIVSCVTFRNLTPVQRYRLAVAKSLCFNCLGHHNVRSCRARTCKTCAGRHHTMLHGAEEIANASTEQRTAQEGSCTVVCPINARSLTLNAHTLHATLLATAVAQARSQFTNHEARLLIDPGSELTLVSESFVDRLNIQRQRSSIPITGIGGKRTSHTRGVATLTLQASNSVATITVRAHILKTLTSIIPSFDAPPQSWPHIENLKLADPDFLKPRSIDIIIGADTYGQVIRPNIKESSPNMPIAQLSIFGWLVLGPMSPPTTNGGHAVHHAAIAHDCNALQELLTQFWGQEELPSDSSNQLSPEEQACEDHFKNTYTRDSTGRYIVRIPLKSPINALGDSRNTARRCLQRLLNRLGKGGEYEQLYHQFMKEYEELDHMVRAPTTPSHRTTHFYLPHHGVFKSSSTTTKMYRQVRVHRDDWDLQRILWLDEQQREIPYQLTTVTYGMRAAPFLAVRALLQLAEDEGYRFPLAVPSITHGRYVDDIFGGADTVPELTQIAQQLKELCNAGGFPLAKWHATGHHILSAISEEDSSNATFPLDDCATKLLGLMWRTQDDKFTFSPKSEAYHGTINKRHILSEVAQIFDPLGFASPVIIKAKMLLQELWLYKVDWDEQLPTQIASRWLTLRENLQAWPSFQFHDGSTRGVTRRYNSTASLTHRNLPWQR